MISDWCSDLFSEEYLVEVEFPISTLFEVNSSKYVTKMCLSDLSISIIEVLRRLNNEFIKSRRLESYLDGKSGFYVFINDTLVKDVDKSLRELLEPNTVNIKIKVLPIFEGG